MTSPTPQATPPPPFAGVLPAVLAGILIPHAIATILVSLRAVSRLCMLRRWFVDDTLIVLAWASCTVVAVSYGIAAQSPSVQFGPGGSVPLPPPAHVSGIITNDTLHDGAFAWSHPPPPAPYLVQIYLAIIFHQFSLLLTKLSILAFYMRIFSCPSSRTLERRLAWLTAAFILLYGVPLLVASFLQCHPLHGLFFGARADWCTDFSPLLIASSTLHSATDIWMILLITPCIARLSVPTKQKKILSCVLSLGVFVVAASMTRLGLSLHEDWTPGGVKDPPLGDDGLPLPPPPFPPADPRHNDHGRHGGLSTLAFFVVTILECDVALICATAPTLRLFVASMWPRFLGGSRISSRRDEEAGSLDLAGIAYREYRWGPSQSLAEPSRGCGGKPSRRPDPPIPPVAAFLLHSPRRRLSSEDDTPPPSRSLLGSEGDGLSLFWTSCDVSTGDAAIGRALTHNEPTGDSPVSTNQKERHSGAETGLGRTLALASQESFVLGLGDPLCPKRLSPMSGWSGATCVSLTTDDERPGSRAGGGEARNDDTEAWNGGA